jgi:hypothetical protein
VRSLAKPAFQTIIWSVRFGHLYGQASFWHNQDSSRILRRDLGGRLVPSSSAPTLESPSHIAERAVAVIDGRRSLSAIRTRETNRVIPLD